MEALSRMAIETPMISERKRSLGCATNSSLTGILET